MFKDKLKPFIDRHTEITRLLSSPDIASDISRMTELSKEQSGLNELVIQAKLYIETADAIEENKELLKDAELGELAKEELAERLNLELVQVAMKQPFLWQMFFVCTHATQNKQDGR